VSTILDALKKLEQEKERHSPPPVASISRIALDDEDYDGSAATRIRATAGKRILMSGAVLLAVVAATGWITANVMSARMARATVEPPARPEAPRARDLAKAVIADESDELPPEPGAAPVSSLEFPEPTESVSASYVELVEIPKPIPMPPALQRAASKPAAPAPRLQPEKRPEPELLGDIDLSTLAILTETERVRLGLPVLKINIVGMPSKQNPRAAALINMQKVYVGEYIPNTNARLIGIELRGVGIEVEGRRYYVSR
jgi:hypothetical protein